METMQRSPERLAVLSQFYLCWCFIALICGIVMDGLLTDYGLSYWWVSGLIAIGLFWIAGRLSFRSLASFYICVVSGWVMLGISAASFETGPEQILSRSDDPVTDAKPCIHCGDYERARIYARPIAMGTRAGAIFILLKMMSDSGLADNTADRCRDIQKWQQYDICNQSAKPWP